MNKTLLSLALLAAGMIGATGPLMAQPPAPASAQSASRHVSDPAAQIADLGRLFRANDLAGLAQALMPPSKWEEAKLQYELKRLQPISDEDRAEFSEKLERFTAADAVDQLMVEIEPELEKARPKVAGAMLMGFGAMQMAVASPDSELTDSQRAALQTALPGIQSWASSTDFLSSDSMRRVLILMTDAARSTGINDIEQLKAMPLEDALNRADALFIAAKEAVRVYGIDLDAVAASLQVELLDIDGDSARVRATVTLFDAPISNEFELVQREGRWYGKHAEMQFNDDYEFEDEDLESANVDNAAGHNPHS